MASDLTAAFGEPTETPPREARHKQTHWLHPRRAPGASSRVPGPSWPWHSAGSSSPPSCCTSSPSVSAFSSEALGQVRGFLSAGAVLHRIFLGQARVNRPYQGRFSTGSFGQPGSGRRASAGWLAALTCVSERSAERSRGRQFQGPVPIMVVVLCIA